MTSNNQETPYELEKRRRDRLQKTSGRSVSNRTNILNVVNECFRTDGVSEEPMTQTTFKAFRWAVVAFVLAMAIAAAIFIVYLCNAKPPL